MSFVYVREGIPDFTFDPIGPVFVSDINKSFEPKKSLDMDGMNMYL
jgi:hypothetical protein